MKKILALMFALLVAATMMVACGDDATAPASVENHPDAVAAAAELNEIFSEMLAELDEMGMTGKMKAYAEAKGTEVIQTMEIAPELLTLMGGLDTFKADAEANPFDDEEMTAKYPGVDKITQTIKTLDGEVLFTITHTK